MADRAFSFLASLVVVALATTLVLPKRQGPALVTAGGGAVYKIFRGAEGL